MTAARTNKRFINNPHDEHIDARTIPRFNAT
jgi:hypothetical protein